MLLHNPESREPVFSFDEVRRFLVDYNQFYARREDFQRHRGMGAIIILEDLQKMRKIPRALRNSLPDDFGLKDIDLDELEEKCMTYLSME